jgi:phosphatidylserine/phosphatidylglycerophosphate/cardiolipin synthase-like enzyme
VPKFETEAEEAQWWFDNRSMVEKEFMAAMRNGTVGRGIARRLASGARNERTIPMQPTEPQESTSSSDLTFLTNPPGNFLGDRLSLLLAHSRQFDCLVGYFYVSGFFNIHPSLEKSEEIRILVGLQTDRSTLDLVGYGNSQGQFDLVSHAEATESMPGDILKELENAPDTAEIERDIRVFIEWVRTGKLKIKAYPSARLHAKLYIVTFADGHIDMGRGITGSSNFTQAGLQDNLEFNVELKTRADYDFSLSKFEDLWKDAVELRRKAAAESAQRDGARRAAAASGHRNTADSAPHHRVSNPQRGL